MKLNTITYNVVKNKGQTYNSKSNLHFIPSKRNAHVLPKTHTIFPLFYYYSNTENPFSFNRYITDEDHNTTDKI